MTQIEMAKAILKEEYGIETEEQLDEAIRKEGGVNIGIFVSPLEMPIEQAG